MNLVPEPPDWDAHVGLTIYIKSHRARQKVLILGLTLGTLLSRWHGAGLIDDPKRFQTLAISPPHAEIGTYICNMAPVCHRNLFSQGIKIWGHPNAPWPRYTGVSPLPLCDDPPFIEWHQIGHDRCHKPITPFYADHTGWGEAIPVLDFLLLITFRSHNN